ncbi:Multidrug resistance protein MdtA, partial [termite gut metagenome]
MKRNTIIISAIAVVAFGTIAWTLVSNKKTVDSKREMKAVNTEIAVTVAPAGMRTINGLLNLVGTAEANHAVTVASELTGSITQVNFKLGDYVSKGTVLAQIDDAYKRLALDDATINYDKYKEDYECYQVLRKGDAVSETQLRDMKVAYENASIQLENAKKQLSDTRIAAPYSGYITSQNIELGAHVNIGSAVAGIVDISQ